jgi:hypothetical protein
MPKRSFLDKKDKGYETKQTRRGSSAILNHKKFKLVIEYKYGGQKFQVKELSHKVTKESLILNMPQLYDSSSKITFSTRRLTF